MKQYNKLFENIILVGKPDPDSDSSIFDEIEAEEAKLAENQDLYTAFDKILKVLEAPSRYEEIQSVAPAIDVNKGIIRIDGVCLHDVKADAQSLNRVEDQDTDEAFTNNIIDLYVKDLNTAIPNNLKVDYDILDDTLSRMDKTRFVIIISRKG